MATDQVNMSVAVSGQEGAEMTAQKTEEKELARIETTKVEFEKIIKLASAVDTDITVFLYPDEVRIWHLTGDKMQLIDISVPDWGFDYYVCYKNARIGINLESLKKVLKSIPKDAKMLIIFYEKKMRIIAGGQKYELITYEGLDEKIVDIEKEETAEFRVDTAEIKNILKVIPRVKYGWTEMTLKTDGVKVFIKYDNDDVKVDSEIDAWFTKYPEEDIEQKYDANRIKNVINAVKAEEIRIAIVNKKVLRISGDQGFKWRWYLAPLAF